ncbi:multidrug efflux SMR transporter [Paenibacillus sp. JTLBN-2024]|jgi:paired small multidrug resistance pump|uniref:Multidrug resistance protein YkkC n=1 Tax=Paenibacillus cookii TaxID=157839 RepID=A0ABQ4LW53_9BACL|nr:multidrug efflux SMR transporter [Paenibacillus cookii]KHF37689.1 Multidrug resistance protein YkkC [Paenibacillus sp. P1XP2]GIO67512.1 multidrug resistance protein YkkC [Paenibacillus cookii]HWO53958.1 multidrug efflux SMR transporter [Paenibacillus cookii]
MNRNWLYVILGGVVEVLWVSGLKHSTNLLEWILTIAAIAVSFYLIIDASNHLPVGTVYAVFTGLGTAGTVVTEMLVFGEPFSWAKTLLILVLLAGVIGLKLITADEGAKKGADA